MDAETLAPQSAAPAGVAIKTEIVVIGAGQAGLSSAYHLRQRGLAAGRKLTTTAEGNLWAQYTADGKEIRWLQVDGYRQPIIRAMPVGGDQSQADSTVSLIGPLFSAENAPLNVASYADQKFTEAEARFIVSGAAAADAAYREGIRANLTKLGIPAAAITAYVNARPALTAANALQEIITEKYVANFLKTEPWNDWRRTGFPVVPLVPQAVMNTLPQRIRAPNSELSSNAVQVAATGFPTGQDGMKVKLWWAGGDNK